MNTIIDMRPRFLPGAPNRSSIKGLSLKIEANADQKTEKTRKANNFLGILLREIEFLKNKLNRKETARPEINSSLIGLKGSYVGKGLKNKVTPYREKINKLGII